MKAERRHALQKNTLATKIVALPDVGKKYGRRAAVVLVLVALVSYLIFSRISTARQTRETVAVLMADSQAVAAQLNGLAILPGEARRVRENLKTILDLSDDPAVRAEAMVLRGDVNWGLAGYPDLPEAATRPEYKPDKPREALMKEAKEAYGEALKTYPDQTQPSVLARFGLAAVAENEAFGGSSDVGWELARQYYQQILQTPGAADTFKQLAQQRLTLLGGIKERATLGTLAANRIPVGPTAPGWQATMPLPLSGEGLLDMAARRPAIELPPPTTTGAGTTAPTTQAATTKAAGKTTGPAPTSASQPATTRAKS